VDEAVGRGGADGFQPEGVELVREEILANRPDPGYCRPGGPGGYGYSDGGRPVCEHASVNGLSREWEELYPRLSALPTGASTWLS